MSEENVELRAGKLARVQFFNTREAALEAAGVQGSVLAVALDDHRSLGSLLP
jgi:hypothetical protein